MPAELLGLDVAAFARAELAPMVRGLFPRAERDQVLDLLAGSVVFLTPANLEPALRRTHWLSTAWDLANLYLTGLGAEALSEEAEPIAGLSEETTCYVSVEYFTGTGRFDDFVVHEAYSRILEMGKSPAERRALLTELEREPLPGGAGVVTSEYVDILREAVATRNGWKGILARCAPVRKAGQQGSPGLAV